MRTIDIRVSVPTDMKDAALARCEELLVHGLVADNEFVESAVILRNTISPHPLGWSRPQPDENTRQER